MKLAAAKNPDLKITIDIIINSFVWTFVTYKKRQNAYLTVLNT